MFNPFSEENNPSLTKFEQMLKTNQVLFFDSVEFESIIHHYIDFAEFSLAKKALKMGMEQHPQNVELMCLLRSCSSTAAFSACPAIFSSIRASFSCFS